MPKEKQRGGKLNAQFHVPPLAPVATINMTHQEQEQNKLKKKTRTRPNKTKHNTKQPRTNKTTSKQPSQTYNGADRTQPEAARPDRLHPDQKTRKPRTRSLQ